MQDYMNRLLSGLLGNEEEDVDFAPKDDRHPIVIAREASLAGRGRRRSFGDRDQRRHQARLKASEKRRSNRGYRARWYADRFRMFKLQGQFDVIEGRAPATLPARTAAVEAVIEQYDSIARAKSLLSGEQA